MIPLLLLLTRAAAEIFCPAATDLLVAYGGNAVKLQNRGWTISGGGGAATRASFDLRGGSVEFDLDFSKVNGGVNANIYTISPALGAAGYSPSLYCDGAKTGSGWCTEIDWIESNGYCGGGTAIHTKEGSTAGSGTARYIYNKSKDFHMKISYAADASFTITFNGQRITSGGLTPATTAAEHAIIANSYAKNGAVIYSSQWVGWVPMASSCPSGGSLGTSVYSVKNLRINGKLVGGPRPTLCAGMTPTPAPTPKPTPARTTWLCKSCQSKGGSTFLCNSCQ